MSIRDYVFSGDVEFADVLGDYIDLAPKNHDVISISKSDVEAMAKHFGLIDELVSVEDKLPDYGEDVLMCNELETIRTGYLLDCDDYVAVKFGGTCKEINSWNIKVTHWKPLPQPPKGTDK